jgi:hypothetical protein
LQGKRRSTNTALALTVQIKDEREKLALASER